MKLQFFSVALLLSLLIFASSIGWQGSGNISQSNLTFIQTTIDTNIATYVPANLAGFSVKIFDTLNDAWAPAWNVFVIRLLDPTVDAVVYGYAFRDHWMWYNGYSYGGNTYSLVLWKDYNCYTWNTITNSMRQTNFGSNMPNYYTLFTKLISFSSTVNQQPFFQYDDVWQTIKYFQEQFTARDPTSAYTVIAAQNGFTTSTDLITNMNGRICSSGGAESYLFLRFANLKSSTGATNGLFKIIIIKTR